MGWPTRGAGRARSKLSEKCIPFPPAAIVPLMQVLTVPDLSRVAIVALGNAGAAASPVIDPLVNRLDEAAVREQAA